MEDVDDPATLARIRAFRRGIQDRSATRVEPFAWGTALFNADFPLSYAHNFLRVERPAADLTVEGLVEEGDRVLGGAGLAHRMVQVDHEPIGEMLIPALRAEGWWAGRWVAMARRRGADRPPRPGVAREASWAEVRPAKEVMTRSEPSTSGEETVRQLVERSTVTARATTLRHFAAFEEGEALSTCDMFSDGRTAQIEEVWTAQAHRGRGLARATILAAAGTAESEGHDLLFLHADGEDWPKDLYARLGFDVVGKDYEFIRWPVPQA